MLIEEFFEDREIFITGGSGFLGKALVEKLLRNCSKIAKIYVLIRSKKGKTPQERIDEIMATSFFNRLRKEHPENIEKVIAIEGDCGELGLGISAADLMKLNNVSIIYNAAASVRFDDHLRTAVMMNVRGTYELVKIAQKLSQLKVFSHISTTFCNPDKIVVKEQIYPPYADWRTTIRLAETYSQETLNIFNLKYSDHQPNTYTFTKSLSEQIINDYRHKLPMVILRPSIVISSVDEPVPGWVDNFNGPIGLMIASGTGILRSSYGNPDVVLDVIPVDVVVRIIIVASYKRGMDTIKETRLLPIYNCAGANMYPITQGEMVDMGKRFITENPFEKTLWAPGGSITKCFVWHFIQFLLMHLLVATLLDLLLRLVGQKPFMLRVQRRIFSATIALFPFITSSWIFKTENVFDLENVVPEVDRDQFSYMHFSNLNQDQFYRNAIKGSKEFLLHEPVQSTRATMLRFKILKLLHWALKTLFVYLIIRGLSNRFLK